MTSPSSPLQTFNPFYFSPALRRRPSFVLGQSENRRTGGLALPIVLHCVNNCGALLSVMHHSTTQAAAFDAGFFWRYCLGTQSANLLKEIFLESITG